MISSWSSLSSKLSLSKTLGRVGSSDSACELGVGGAESDCWTPSTARCSSLPAREAAGERGEDDPRLLGFGGGPLPEQFAMVPKRQVDPRDLVRGTERRDEFELFEREAPGRYLAIKERWKTLERQSSGGRERDEVERCLILGSKTLRRGKVV